MGFNTKAFGTIYKRIPTGSFLSASNEAFLYVGNVLTGSWDKQTNLTNLTAEYSSSFVNYPQDYRTTITFPVTINLDHTIITTRASASNAGYVAIPWGSMACDFLWNVKTPQWNTSLVSGSWNFVGGSTGYVGGNYTSSAYRVSFENTQSFFRQYTSSSAAPGVAYYDITSSWYVWDEKFENDTNFNIPIKVVSTNSLGIPAMTYNITSSFVTPYSPAGDAPQTGIDYANTIGYDITWPNKTGSNATSAIDGQYFDRGGGAAITRLLVSKSIADQQAASGASSGLGLAAFYGALKNRRLFYPTPVSGSGTTGGTDYWHRQMTGYKSTEMFNENGGIYNVQFTLKRHVPSDHYPDSGSFMSVFIHDVATKSAPVPTERVPGTKGWYPPANNIVTVGHGYNGGPVMSFFDQQTGYYYERFNINLVQYGVPAQLCFEPSGSLVDNDYFGIIIDDVSICKIGVTTDPRFIKPATVASSVYYELPQDLGDIPVDR